MEQVFAEQAAYFAGLPARNFASAADLLPFLPEKSSSNAAQKIQDTFDSPF